LTIDYFPFVAVKCGPAGYALP